MKTFLLCIVLFLLTNFAAAQHRVEAKAGENVLQIHVVNQTNLSLPALRLQLRGENLPWFKQASSLTISVEPFSASAYSNIRRRGASLPFQLTAPPSEGLILLELSSGGRLIGSVPLSLTTSPRQGTLASDNATGGTVGRELTTEQPVDHPSDGKHPPLPTAYALHPNYPNPFNPETVIEYDLPQPSMVILSVYDLLGREVIRLVEGIQQAGRHRAVWSGRDAGGNRVAGGMYLYILSAGTQRYHGKMLFVP